MALIDKDQIRAEIERRLSWRITLEARAAYNNILRFLDTLPEQPVEGLEEEFARFKELNRWGYKEVDREFVRSNGWRLQVSDVMNIARHFAEWGRKQVLQDIYDGKCKPVDRITSAWLED